MPYLFVVLTFVGVSTFIIWKVVAQSRQSAANLQALAQKLGLEYRQQKFGLFDTVGAATGKLMEREVGFHQFTTGSGKTEQKWCAVSVFPKETGRLTFNLHQQGWVSKLEALFGAREATVGDEAFDKTWFLQTNEPEFLGAALVPEIREKLMAAQAAGGLAVHFRLEKGTVRYAELGDFSSDSACARLEQMLPVLYDLADIAEVAAARDL